MNETGNTGYISAETVPPDLRHMIPGIIRQRSKMDARSPLGRRLSTLVEQIENGVSPAQTVAEIDQIQRDGGRYIHANHMKGEA